MNILTASALNFQSKNLKGGVVTAGDKGVFPKKTSPEKNDIFERKYDVNRVRIIGKGIPQYEYGYGKKAN